MKLSLSAIAVAILSAPGRTLAKSQSLEYISFRKTRPTKSEKRFQIGCLNRFDAQICVECPKAPKIGRSTACSKQFLILQHVR